MTASGLRRIGEQRDILGESPIWSVAEQALYWVDIRRPALRRLDHAAGTTQTRTMPGLVGAIAFTAVPGRLLVALAERIALYNWAQDRLETVATLPRAIPDHRFNDGRCDRQGRFWVGTMNNVTRAPEGVLYRLDGSGLTEIATGICIPNSLAWSPDGRTMYHSHTMTGEINAWDYDPATGEMTRSRLFARVEGAPGPDGAEVDRDGFYWTAINGQGRILRFDPNGRIERALRVPFKYPTMVTFGGPDLRTIFVTSGRWPIPDKDAADYPLDGGIFAFEAPVPGLPTSRWAG